MAISANNYFSAALEHLASAQWLHDQKQFALAHYLAGTSVECMLRAYLRRTSDEFDPRHDLERLASASRFFDHIPVALHTEYGQALQQLNRRWRSSQRYLAAQGLWSYLSEIKVDRGLKGDRRKNHSRAMLNLAHQIVKWGETKWQS